MKYPGIFTVEELRGWNTYRKTKTGRWVPARSLGLSGIGNRLKCAWLVFTGRADALTWPGDQ